VDSPNRRLERIQKKEMYLMQLGQGSHTPQNNTQNSPNRKGFKGGSPSKSPGKTKT
jgi:hypothetical protein